jgi:predicted Zn-dependent protease
MNARSLMLLAVIASASIFNMDAAEAGDQVDAIGQNGGHGRELDFAGVVATGSVANAINKYESLPDSVRREGVFRLAYFDLLIEARQLEKAMTVGSEITKEYPKTGRVLCAIGVLKIQLGDLDEGMKQLKEAIVVDPWYAHSYYELARVSPDPREVVSLCARGMLMARDNRELTASLTTLAERGRATIAKAEAERMSSNGQ